MKTKKVLGAAVVAALAVFAGTAAAGNVCQGPNGYSGEGKGNAQYTYPAGDPLAGTTITTTWGAIAAASINTKAKVKGACEVKDLMFSPNLRPRAKMYPVDGEVAGMNGDKCSLYKLAASVHWMLDRGDLYDAHVEALQIVASVDALGGYVSNGGDIRAAAVRVADCIALQLP